MMIAARQLNSVFMTCILSGVFVMRSGAFFKAHNKVISAFLIAVSLVSFYPEQASAFSLFGIHLWGKDKETVDPEMTDPKTYKIEVKAAPGAPEDGVKAAEAASSLVADKKKPVSGSAGLLAKARGDYKSILAALYAQGRYGGVISIKLNGREVADIPPYDEVPDESTIVITIDSGPEYHFSSAQVRDFAPPTNDKKDQVGLLEKSGYARGDIATSGSILNAEKLAISSWKQQGHAKAEIKKREVIADHANRTVEADIEVNPGMVAYYGPLTVRNVSKNPHMDSDYVAWMTGLKEGQEYDPDDLVKANKRLAKLEVFHSSNVREGRKIGPDGVLPLNLILQERPLHRFGVGASYSTLDGAGFETYWMHRNLFGKAERLRFDAKVSGIGGSQDDSYNPKNFSYSVGTSFIKPGVYTPDMDFVANLKAERAVLDNYTATGVYGQLGFTRQFNDELSGRIYFNAAQTKTEDNYFGDRNFTTVGFLGGITYDSRDKATDAHNGFFADANFEPFYEIQYGNFINKLTLEGRTYFTFDEDNRYTLALRAKLGSIAGAEAAEIPSDRLFFAGGGGSVRGYGYRNIGIKTETGDIIGGRSLAEGSVEMRAMVTKSIGVVGFADVGVVGKNSYPDFSENSKIGAGFGVRYLTGMGPLRFDLAVPLDSEKGDPDVGIYIGIGQAF